MKQLRARTTRWEGETGRGWGGSWRMGDGGMFGCMVVTRNWISGREEVSVSLERNPQRYTPDMVTGFAQWAYR